MKIDFNKIEETTVSHFKGGEGHYIMRHYTDDKVKIMRGKLEPGCSIGMHCHEMNCEVMYILSGTATYVCDGEEEKVLPGEVHYNPMGKEHTLMNKGEEDLVFFAVVSEQR
ncbi:MAG: cupin domain-containing protein [Prevotellaceae bacterium]|nr:cupin domain-containing protein [Prevotella sp.]MDD7258295.1 cupin domain-containing protein [Prevotellaceae bacterium]MDY6130224.1 cupin domain-containing protein [Prevotella sp.]